MRRRVETGKMVAEYKTEVVCESCGDVIQDGGIVVQEKGGRFCGGAFGEDWDFCSLGCLKAELGVTLSDSSSSVKIVISARTYEAAFKLMGH